MSTSVCMWFSPAVVRIAGDLRQHWLQSPHKESLGLCQNLETNIFSIVVLLELFFSLNLENYPYIN